MLLVILSILVPYTIRLRCQSINTYLLEL